jgi:hypothetical protein
VLAHAVLVQLLEQVAERVLTDLAKALRRELEAALLVLDEPRVLEELRELAQPLE